MSYSTNPATLRRIERSFVELLETGRCRWRTPSNKAGNWAYRLREGLSIAKQYPDQFPRLARVAARIQIRVISSQCVEATIQDIPLELPFVTDWSDTVPDLGEHVALTPLQVVMQYHGMSPIVMHNVDMTPELAHNLRVEALAHETPLMLLYAASQRTLTIALEDANVPAEARL